MFTYALNVAQWTLAIVSSVDLTVLNHTAAGDWSVSVTCCASRVSWRLVLLQGRWNVFLRVIGSDDSVRSDLRVWEHGRRDGQHHQLRRDDVVPWHRVSLSPASHLLRSCTDVACSLYRIHTSYQSWTWVTFLWPIPTRPKIFLTWPDPEHVSGFMTRLDPTK